TTSTAWPTGSNGRCAPTRRCGCTKRRWCRARRERARPKRAGVETNGVKRWLGVFLVVLAVSDGGCSGAVFAVPTRPGIVERVLVLTRANPKAVVLLFAGGHGGLGIRQNGIFTWGAPNFLVRSRDLFVSQGLTVVVVDAPSDHQNSPYLYGFRQTPEHVAD